MPVTAVVSIFADTAFAGSSDLEDDLAFWLSSRGLIFVIWLLTCPGNLDWAGREWYRFGSMAADGYVILEATTWHVSEIGQKMRHVCPGNNRLAVVPGPTLATSLSDGSMLYSCTRP